MIQYSDQIENNNFQSRLIHVPSGIISKSSFFDFFAKELKFPGYFGRNWDAFDECLGDLSWLNGEDITIIHEDLPLLPSPNDARIYLEILDELSNENEFVKLRVVFPAKLRKYVSQLLGSTNEKNPTEELLKSGQ